jgi:hypothetical protein
VTNLRDNLLTAVVGTLPLEAVVGKEKAREPLGKMGPWPYPVPLGETECYTHVPVRGFVQLCPVEQHIEPHVRNAGQHCRLPFVPFRQLSPVAHVTQAPPPVPQNCVVLPALQSLPTQQPLVQLKRHMEVAFLVCWRRLCFPFLLASASLAAALIPTIAPKPPKTATPISFSARPRVRVPSARLIAKSSRERLSHILSAWAGSFSFLLDSLLLPSSNTYPLYTVSRIPTIQSG